MDLERWARAQSPSLPFLEAAYVHHLQVHALLHVVGLEDSDLHEETLTSLHNLEVKKTQALQAVWN